jgi:U2-associated protein SR140
MDTSSAKLIGLYLVSDILSSSATSGVRHAWRYRQLFESALKSHRVFEHLGRLEKDLNWGRLRAEKWKRSVGSLLHLWEGWCVFPQSSQEHFSQVFERPPLTEEELREEKAKAEADRAAGAAFKGKNRWKTLEEDETAGKFDPSRPPAQPDHNRMDIDQGHATSAGDLVGEPMSDIDGEPMEDSDLEEAPDGEPLEEDSAMETEQKEEAPSKSEAPSQLESGPPVRKPRPKAEDMFADSDTE